jgi:transposase
MLALAQALVMEGHSRIKAARTAGMDRQTLRDWVHRYNEGGLAGLHNAATRGRPPRRLTPAQEATVSAWVRQGPSRERQKVVRWRLVDLRDEIAQAFGVRLHERSVGKLMARLNFAHVSARPRHPEQDVAIQEAHKKISRVGRRLHPRACARQADRAVVAGRSTGRSAGQPDLRLGREGSRPRAPRDQRYEWDYLFGAVCPARGIGAALVLPEINTEAMNLHLAEISRCVAPGAHAVINLDGAG